MLTDEAGRIISFHCNFIGIDYLKGVAGYPVIYDILTSLVTAAPPKHFKEK